MSEPFVLKVRVGINTLSHLNDHQKNRMGRLKGALECFSTNEPEEIVDIVHAVFSGKKIVNPMSPRDELKQWYDGFSAGCISHLNVRESIEKVIEIIAKEHPDVADWLKDSDKDE